MSDPTTIIEVFADVACPFTHVGLRSFVARRDLMGRHDVRIWVRAWPLEVVNGEPLDPHFVAEEVDDIRVQAAPSLFAGFREATFPATSVPAMALAAAAYRQSPATGESVSLALRDMLFEQGLDIGASDVLAGLGAEHGIAADSVDLGSVLADHREGVARGVIGSPHFFTPHGGFFCPSLDVSRDAGGHLQVLPDPAAFEAFVDACLT